MAFNAKAFLEALEEIEISKGISKETVISALTESLTKAFKRELGGDDAIVRVNLDVDLGTIEMVHIKNIVSNVEDDFLEISKTDAKDLAKQGVGYIEGEEYIIPATVEQMRKATALTVKSMMKQKFAEAEKNILYEAFKDKIGTMITGRVDKADERGLSVNIGRSSVYVPKNQLVGDEKYYAGDTIKLYVNSVESSVKGGARIVVTRSNEGFLKCLFFEEIHEIYDGTIIIKNVAREAGERSKVAVYSNDPNVDPAGACIGPNGSRIQKIVGQLGNGGTSHEKIDIIAYSENAGLYIMEALKPAKVAGIICDVDNKSATAIVRDDSLSLAIGRRGVNARLAVKLTGYNIDIKTETEAIEAGLTYQTFEELEAKEIEERSKKAMELASAQHAALVGDNILPGLPKGYVAPQERVYVEDTEEDNDYNDALEEQVEKEEINNEVNNVVTPAVEETVDVKPEEVVTDETPTVVEEEVVEEVKVSEPKVEEKLDVKTTTSIEELEKNLESSSKQSKKQYTKKTSRKKKDEEDEDDTSGKITDTSSSQRMAIYTEEELREFEEEEENDYEDEDEVDYDDYDDYYDEK